MDDEGRNPIEDAILDLWYEDGKIKKTPLSEAEIYNTPQKLSA